MRKFLHGIIAYDIMRKILKKMNCKFRRCYMKGWTIFGVIAAIIIAIAAVVIMGYNGLVQQNEDVNSKWAQVENQLHVVLI